MKIGLIVRNNNRGLGIQSWEFYKHLKPYKTLAIEFSNDQCYRERYKDARFCREKINDDDIDWLLDGTDIILSFEVFYNNKIIDKAKKKGVKTVLQTNYEYYNNRIKPDLIISPTLWNYNKLPDPKIYLPVPINRELLPFKLRKEAKIFLHNAGNSKAVYDRDGTEVILKAIPFIKSNIKFIIKSQTDIPKINDRRVEYIIKDENYYEQWNNIKADILVYPRRYGGLSLVVNEAMSVGMPIIMTDMKPQNEFLPKELLVKPKKITEIDILQTIEIAIIDHKKLANKIDEVANMSSKHIQELSKWSDYIAQQWSWENLLPKYLKVFKNL